MSREPKAHFVWAEDAQTLCGIRDLNGLYLTDDRYYTRKLKLCGNCARLQNKRPYISYLDEE